MFAIKKISSSPATAKAKTLQTSSSVSRPTINSTPSLHKQKISFLSTPSSKVVPETKSSPFRLHERLTLSYAPKQTFSFSASRRRFSAQQKEPVVEELKKQVVGKEDFKSFISDLEKDWTATAKDDKEKTVSQSEAAIKGEKNYGRISQVLGAIVDVHLNTNCHQSSPLSKSSTPKKKEELCWKYHSIWETKRFAASPCIPQMVSREDKEFWIREDLFQCQLDQERSAES